MGSLLSTIISVLIALAVVVGVFTGLNLLTSRLPGRWEARVRPWVFIGPALIFLVIGLVVPALRTIYVALHDGRRGEGGWTLDNFGDALGDDTVLNFDGASDILTSWLFQIAVVTVILAIGVAWISARRMTDGGGGSGGGGGRGAGPRLALSGPTPATLLVIGGIALLFAVFSTMRGVVWNNLWWVTAVTGLATIVGLLLAVLADRSRGETVAKTLIFMPMAISMVGAAVIWSFVYNLPAAGQSPGLLNAIIGQLGIDQVDFVRSGRILPWNNFFIMIIMIWIQTGFAMVVFSAAIKSVPTELVEAAKVDGANDAQVFWRITLPQITPTVVVVVTTLVVTVMKVFDLVKATTNGNFDTDVLANRMYEGLRNGNFAQSSTFAVIILMLVVPVIWLNFRRARREVAR